jgi:hypothetical protein
LSYALLKKKVNYVLDADIQGFFEVEKLAEAQRKFSAELPPVEALRAWMLIFIDYIAAKKIIAPGVERNGRRPFSGISADQPSHGRGRQCASDPRRRQQRSSARCRSNGHVARYLWGLQRGQHRRLARKDAAVRAALTNSLSA